VVLTVIIMISISVARCARQIYPSKF